MNQIGCGLPRIKVGKDFICNAALRGAQHGAHLPPMSRLILCEPYRIAQALRAHNPYSTRFLQPSHRLRRYAKLSRHPLIRNFLLLHQLLQESLLCDLFLPAALTEQGNDLLPAHQALQCTVFEPFHGLLRRDHSFQRLYHGGTVILPDPSGEGNESVLHTGILCRNLQNILDSLRVKLAVLPDLNDISLQLAPTVAEGHCHAHTDLQPVSQTLRHAVLKRLIQFFMRNIHNDICIKFRHANPHFCAIRCAPVHFPGVHG